MPDPAPTLYLYGPGGDRVRVIAADAAAWIGRGYSLNDCRGVAADAPPPAGTPPAPAAAQGQAATAAPADAVSPAATPAVGPAPASDSGSRPTPSAPASARPAAPRKRRR